MMPYSNYIPLGYSYMYVGNLCIHLNIYIAPVMNLSQVLKYGYI